MQGMCPPASNQELEEMKMMKADRMRNVGSFNLFFERNQCDR